MRIILCIIAAALLSFATLAHAAVDHAAYGELLAKHVRGGLVDYFAFKKDHGKLKSYLKSLAAINPDTLERNEAYAYYINLYNAATIDLILDNYPGIDSIKDIGGLFGSPWKKEFIELKGEKVHLDHVEHDILRPTYKDPRVHFAVNCASMGCPPLHTEPFEGKTLDSTLDMLTRNVMADPRHTRLEGDELYVNRVFDWFGGDWGSDEEKIAFVQQYSPQAQAAKIAKLGKRLDLEYSHWDWALNDVKRK